MSSLYTISRIGIHAPEVPFRQLPSHREVPAPSQRTHGGPPQVRLRVREDRRRDRQRPVLAPPGQPVHRGREVPHDRRGPEGGRGRQLQHRARRGPEPLLGVGGPRREHVPPVRPGVHQQPDDPQAVRGGRLRGQRLAALRQGALLGHGDPQEDPGGGGLEAPGPECGGGRHRQDRRAGEDRRDIQG